MDYTLPEILQVDILEWVAFPFSRESSQRMDGIQVSHIAGGFFTNWTTWEANIVSTWGRVKIIWNNASDSQTRQ